MFSPSLDANKGKSFDYSKVLKACLWFQFTPMFKLSQTVLSLHHYMRTHAPVLNLNHVAPESSLPNQRGSLEISREGGWILQADKVRSGFSEGMELRIETK